MGEHGGSIDERWASVLRTSESGSGRGRVRRVRRRVVRGVLRRADGASESASWAVFPDASSGISMACRRSAGLRGGPIL